MTSLSKDSRTSAQARVQRKNFRRLVILVLFVLLAIVFTLRPPFVLRPLKDQASRGTGSETGQSAASKFVDPIWTSKVLPTFEEKAQDIAKVLPEIRADPDAAGSELPL